MLCTLRIYGPALNIEDTAALIAATPYRIDRTNQDKAKMNCLYYDVVKRHNGTFSELLGQVGQWLEKTKGIEHLKARNDVQYADLDFGIFIEKESVSSSYALNATFLAIVNNLKLSITMSVYKKEEDNQI